MRYKNWATGRFEPFLLLDYGRAGLAFDETEPGFSRKACRECIASQDHGGRLVAVYRAIEGHFENVSEDIARQALDQLLEGDWLFESGFDAPHPIPDFIHRYCADAHLLVREAARERRA